MRHLLLLWLVIAACEACARTRGGGGGGGGPGSGGPGSPAPGSPGGGPGGGDSPTKECPTLMTFAPDGSFQLVSAPTTTVSGDTTTATCPAGGTSFLLPDGTSSTAALSCSTATGTWSFDDGTAFDATTTAIACGAKCAPCMLTAIDLNPPIATLPTATDSTDQCNTPTSPMCPDAANPLLIGANMDGTRYVGNAIMEPVMCVGGKWVDASNGVYDNLACATPPSDNCGDTAALTDPTMCSADTGKTCVSPTVTPMPYSGTNALLGGQTTLSVVCPADSPILHLNMMNLGDGSAITRDLDAPLSDADANFECSGGLLYLNAGIALSAVTAIACVPA